MPDTTSVHAVLLSYDMFLAIANELDAADLVSATQVCADWRRALKSSVPWRRACLRESLDEYDPRPVPQTDDHWHKLALEHLRVERNWARGRFVTANRATRMRDRTLTVQAIPSNVSLEGPMAFLYARNKKAAPLATWPQASAALAFQFPHTRRDVYEPQVEHITTTSMLASDHGFETAVLDPATLSELCPDERRGEHVKTHVYNDHDLVMSTNKVKLVILRNFREVFRRAATLATTAERGALLVSHTIVVDFGRPVNKIRVSRTRILLAMAWDMVVLDSRNLPRMPLAPGAPRPTLSALFLRSSIPWPFSGYTEIRFDSRAIYMVTDQHYNVVVYRFDE